MQRNPKLTQHIKISREDAMNLNQDPALYAHYQNSFAFDSIDVSNRTFQVEHGATSFPMKGRVRTKRGDYRSIDGIQANQQSARNSSHTAEPGSYR